MRRRTFLRAGALTGATALAGCGGLETRSAREPPLVEDRPDAVYVPSHMEGMQMVATREADRRNVGLMYSFPHRFWTITGTRTKMVEIGEGDSVHLMATVWDGETGTVLPVGSGLSVTIERDGETVDDRAPWTMLSQNMGFHYGDNVPLSGDGTYTVTVDVGAMSLRRFGAFDGEFGDPVSVEFDFEYSSAERDEIPFERLDDRAGERGALDPMEMMVPLSFAPGREDLPGRVVGRATSGDAVFLAATLERDGEPYLAVSPRTPHNGYVIPMMALSGTVERDGETVFEDVLEPAIDPELGYHYGAAVDVRDGDTLELSVDTPPQVSRHEGYETAFVEMAPMELTVGG